KGAFSPVVDGGWVEKTMVVGVPALKLTAVRPGMLAVTVFTPAPNVQLDTVARPDALVICVAPVRLPPPAVTANTTVTPAIGAPPASRTSTVGEAPAGEPAAPLCVTGELAV